MIRQKHIITSPRASRSHLFDVNLTNFEEFTVANPMHGAMWYGLCPPASLPPKDEISSHGFSKHIGVLVLSPSAEQDLSISII